ncbi:MAG: universal stress protein [Sedimentibacter sp.]|uniref:universal stress protein n=1 Tax=Sedimentibacter sp. TaxID=1960295 RepID=UPI003158C6EC
MKKILVPVDGSDASKKAALKAVEMAKKYDGSITFMYVASMPADMTRTRYGIVVPYDFGQIEKDLREEGRKFLDSFVAEVDSGGIRIDKIPTFGEPYEEILRTAAEGNFELIVMGRRGFSKIKRFFIGSVTQRVISDSPCPVYVVVE